MNLNILNMWLSISNKYILWSMFAIQKCCFIFSEEKDLKTRIKELIHLRKNGITKLEGNPLIKHRYYLTLHRNRDNKPFDADFFYI